MNILYVYAHPSSTSFNFKLKEKGCEILSTKNKLILSDLYALQFNAVADFNDFNLQENHTCTQYFIAQKQAFTNHLLSNEIDSEIKKIEWANHIFFQFPLWWFSVPAILKGWFDRILIKGFAYDAGKIFSEGLLKNKTSSCIVTTQSTEAAYQENGLHQATIHDFLFHIHHTLRFVGLKTLDPFIEYGVIDIDIKREENILANYQNYLKTILNNS